MGRKKGAIGITREVYEQLVDLYRQYPGQHKKVADSLGRSPPFARRGWEEGWRKYWWAPPIKDRLQEERERAAGIVKQARACAGRDEKFGELIDQISDSISQEEFDKQALRDYSTQMKAAEQLTLTDAAAVNRNLFGAIRELTAEASTLVAKVVEGIPKMTSFEARVALRDIVKMVKDMADINHQTMVSHRLHLGEPGEIVQHEVQMSEDDMMHRLQLAAKAHARMERRLTEGIEVPADVVEVVERKTQRAVRIIEQED